MDQALMVNLNERSRMRNIKRKNLQYKIPVNTLVLSLELWHHTLAVRALELQSGGLTFNPHPSRYLDFFLVVLWFNFSVTRPSKNVDLGETFDDPGF